MADDPAALLSQFSATGKFSSNPSLLDGGGVLAAHGAAAASTSVGAGQTATLSVVFAWHFPDRNYKSNRDHSLHGQILGNFYANLWPDSAAVAAELATEARLASVVADINAHHDSIASLDNPMPVWLKDQLLNQWSHFHMLMWYRDGRMREYEAWSCDDVDSVHNDYQRHLIYLWAFPEFEQQKVRAWGSWAQDASGARQFLSQQRGSTASLAVVVCALLRPLFVMISSMCATICR